MKMTPSLIRACKITAREGAAWRGHDMTAWSIVGPLMDGTREYHSACRICGAYVRVRPDPAPNSTDVGGTAVALNCPAPATHGSEKDQARALGRKIRARKTRMDRDGYVNGQYYGFHPNAIYDVTTDTSSYMVRARSRDAAVASVARIERNKKATQFHGAFYTCRGCGMWTCVDPSCQAQGGEK